MTHNPEQEPTAGGEQPDWLIESPTAPDQRGPDWEVLMGPGGPEPEWTPPGAALRERWYRRSARARALTTAATVVALGLGGTVAYAATSSGSSDSASAAASGSSSDTSSDTSSDDDNNDRPWGGPGMWFGGGSAAHGEATVEDGDDWVVQIWQSGTIEELDGNEITVKSEDGAEWTWTVDEDATIYHDGSSSSEIDDLEEGETAFLSGTRSDDDTRTATRVATSDSEDDEDGDDDAARTPGSWRF
ncbi:DUF5666 domain-containing protein [Streptomyces blattellae]|uniref:DUF5666 domain-containing protein n=1 Tax=Streptomyces blattellae TaxID=2569855 RepID=UPI0012B7B5AE|nr:DUF5666 domain-containing protein [Streptomyces blattellae]